MTVPAAPAASAQGSTATTEVSASMAAAGAGDFDAFERAESAKAEGKPLPDVKVKATADSAAGPGSNHPAAAGKSAPGAAPNREAAAAAGQDDDDDLEPAGAGGAADVAAPDNKRTRAQREQDRINSAVRAGIEAAQGPLLARIKELEAGAGGKAGAEGAAASAAKPQTPEWKRYLEMEGAPQLEDFDTTTEHNAAMAVFIANQKLEESRTADARAALQGEQLQGAQKRVDTFLGRLETAKADPAWAKGLSPEVIALKPFGALDPSKGEVGGPANFVAEEIMDSDIPERMMTFLSQQDAQGVSELQKVLAVPAVIQNMRDPVAMKRAHMAHMRRLLHRIEGRLLDASTDDGGGETREPAANRKPPVAAVPPPTKHIARPRATSDPRKAAIENGDFTAFDAIEQQRETERRQAGRVR